MKKKKNGIALAPIDALPEDLLLHIISFLPTLEAIRTCLISRKWRTLWHSLSSFHFDFNLFPPSDSFPETRDSFTHYVTQTLSLRSPQSPLHYFGLRFYFTEQHHYDIVPSWINYAINHGAIELDLDFHGYSDFSELDSDCCFYFLLEPLIESSVRVLRLHSCHLGFPDTITTVPIVSLQTIVLANVLLMDDWVVWLISLCVNLESLVIEDCFGPDNLKLCSTKLKELSIWNFEDDPEPVDSVEICAPNLCSLSIVCLEMGTFSLECSSSLIEAKVVYSSRSKQFEYWSKVVRSLPGVMSLTTPNWWFELLQTKDALPEGFALNNLVYFDMETVYNKNDMKGLAAFMELCPKLEMVIMDYYDDKDDDVRSQHHSSFFKLVPRKLKTHLFPTDISF
ncbi:hypothetical protein Vadar_007190 [Vaccinium darrowii]|uniref:Uncharacterized protein n=1 Tax=Vaccinium darrowii TaxID=229202 RepID=A0ACB7Z346_9ERIC|nr:hypothetical protein Vadar_007190 [Vaccinium darrowii]